MSKMMETKRMGGSRAASQLSVAGQGGGRQSRQHKQPGAGALSYRWRHIITLVNKYNRIHP